jgi:hypothetical protein
MKTHALLRPILAVGLALVSLTSAYSQTLPTNGLVSYYAFDGSLTANLINAPITWSTAVQYVTDRFGRSGRALLLDGASYGTIANQAATSFSGEFTTTLWSLALPNPPFGNGRILSVSSPSGYEVGRSQDFGLTQYEPLLIFSNSDKSDILASLSSISQNQWVMFTVRYKAGLASFWVNSNKVHEFSAGQPSGGSMNVGQKSDENFDKFLGNLDDLRFYNRALSDTEIQSLYVYDAVQTPPPFCSTPRRATATATIVNGFLVGTTITDSGCGYTNPPTVLIQGGGGTGATATATVSNGVVTGITVTSAGCCYTSTPKVVIGSPPFLPYLNIAVSKVNVTQNVTLGRNYVLESSSNAINWTATGPQFTADSESIVQEFEATVGNRYFRIRQVP